MPAVYQIDKQRKLVTSTGSGVLTREDIAGHMNRLTSDPDFDPEFSQLADFTQGVSVQLGPEDMRLFAERTVFSATSRRAFLVKNDLQYGLARMFEIHRELNGESGIRVFRSLEEAMLWIEGPSSFLMDSLPSTSPRD